MAQKEISTLKKKMFDKFTLRLQTFVEVSDLICWIQRCFAENVTFQPVRSPEGSLSRFTVESLSHAGKRMSFHQGFSFLPFILDIKINK